MQTKAALVRYTHQALATMRREPDEAAVLRGVDWAAVEHFVNLERKWDKTLPGGSWVGAWAGGWGAGVKVG